MNIFRILKQQENGQHKCIVLSLYGLKDLYEVSKALYLESRMKFLNSSSEKMVTGQFAAKTVLKGITSFFGIDLSKTEDELKALYDSVDLSGKLVVFEDLERSGINIIEILGYVNNLVEHDGVKVLLVANENEILNYIDSPPDKEGKTHKIPDANTELYLKTKEKTVSDTIRYFADINGAIEGILKSFDNKIINDMLSPKDEKGNIQIISDIQSIMETIHCRNLRSVIFGCQKTVDLYNKYANETFNTGFLAYLLCSNIAFALRLKMDRNFEICSGVAIFKSPINFSTSNIAAKLCSFK